MASTWLWIGWAILAAGGFYLLERPGLRSATDRRYTLTNRIRALMRVNPVLRALIVGAVVAFASFLVWHFVLTDPFASPGT